MKSLFLAQVVLKFMQGDKIHMTKIEVSQASVGDGGKCGNLCSSDVWWCQIEVSELVGPR